jgi:hypothetical protein
MIFRTKVVLDSDIRYLGCAATALALKALADAEE